MGLWGNKDEIGKLSEDNLEKRGGTSHERLIYHTKAVSIYLVVSGNLGSSFEQWHDGTRASFLARGENLS